MKDFSSRGMAILFAASFAFCTSLPVLAEEEEQIEEQIEEITVTGSYIKRSSFNSPVPLDVIDRAEMADLGAVGIEEVIQNLTYTSPAGIRTGLLGGWTGGGGINLRGLGTQQTLILFNGRRVQTGGGPGAVVNISTLVPQIAIQRLEIVRDGAGALYGSDAVAGVGNFITRNNFEGLEIMLFSQVDGETHKQRNHEIAGIWGGSFEQGRFMMAMSYVDRSPLLHYDRTDLPGARTGPTKGSSGMGNGKMYVPLDVSQLTTPPGIWGGGGAATKPYSYNEWTNTLGVPDIDCGIMGTVKKAWGWPHLCGYDYAPFYPIEEDQQKFLYFTNVDWEWSDNTTIHMELSYMNTEAYRPQSGWPFNTQPVIPKYNPGSVEDARRREAACAAETGDVCGIVPIDLSFKGRFGIGIGGVIGGVKPLEVRDTQKMRLVLSADGELPFADGWTWDVAFTFGELRGLWYNHDGIKDDVQDALNGLGGAFCDENNPTNQAYAKRGMIAPGSTCQFWNPFLNAYVKADGSVQGDPLLVNTNETIQTFQGQTRTTGHTQAIFIDAVVTGDLFELTNGLPVAMAVGVQYREEWEEWLRADNMKNFGFLFVEGDVERNLDRDMYAVFGELSVPVLENLEVQLAIRYEDFGDGKDSTDPKIAVLYTPIEDLNIRGSFGTSFRMPTLAQTTGSSLELANIADGSRGSYYIVTQTYGDASLMPEEADVWNLGFSWKPTNLDWLEGFTMDLDYYSVDHTDKITTENNQDLIDQENDTGVLDPRIIRDPVSGQILRLVKSRINSDSREVAGYDLTLGYSREVDNYGSFAIRSTLSWYDTYKMTTTDRITGKTTTTRGVGWANYGGSPLQELPEYKWNTTLSWNFDRHRVVATFRYVPEFEQDGNGQNEIAAAIGKATKDLGTNRQTNATFTQLDPNCPLEPSREDPCTIEDFLSIDLQYTYRLPEWGFQQEGSQIQLGIINVTNEAPPVVNDDPGWIANLHDPRGRLFYLRYAMNLF